MSTPISPFITQFNGYFSNLLRWDQFDACWQQLNHQAEQGWYLYAVGEPLPQQPVDGATFSRFLSQIAELLRREHEESYCGIVYVDSREQPSFVKIYDPHHLGSVCGSSSQPPPLPGWVLSLTPPVPLEEARPHSGSRKRWWQSLFG